MRNRSVHGGRQELGQNFLVHRPAIAKVKELVSATRGPILEIGAGDGALTDPLARLGRPLRAIDIDEHRVARLQRRLPEVDIAHADAMQEPFDRPVVVGNLPFSITTPLLRRMLDSPNWMHAIVLTQWEVARKRAGVGGSTMMAAQAAPWFTFELHGRVPAYGFMPRPNVDGGILTIRRRPSPLVEHAARRRYGRFVHSTFTGPGRGIADILRLRSVGDRRSIRQMLDRYSIRTDALPRDLKAEQWVQLWDALGTNGLSAMPRRRKVRLSGPRNQAGSG